MMMNYFWLDGNIGTGVYAAKDISLARPWPNTNAMMFLSS
jgi:hypothetical protein